MPPPTVVRMLIESPARIVAVRPGHRRDPRIGEHAAVPFWINRLICGLKADSGAGERLQRDQLAGLAGERVGRRLDLAERRADRGRAELQAQIARAALVDLEDLGVEHDRLRNDVELRDQLLGGAHALRAAGDDQLLRAVRNGDAQVGVGDAQRLLHRRRDVLRGRRAAVALARHDRLQVGSPCASSARRCRRRCCRARRSRAGRGRRAVEPRDPVGDALLVGRGRGDRDARSGPRRR